MVKMTVNGVERTHAGDPSMPLLWFLRDEAQLTGTKYGCGMALCGACTVHLDGAAIRSCVLPVADKVGQAVQAAWRTHDVVQCGYCQSGQIMSAVALLQANPAPGDADIDTAMNGNVCRCATYVRIRAAIHSAAQALKA
jgi:isoquinoline 1-oxidoreductase subunit alpha